jgi:hypothetical protein
MSIDLANTSGLDVDNTSGLSNEAAFELLRNTGVEITYGKIKFVVESRFVEDALALVIADTKEQRARLKESIVKSLTRFEQRLSKRRSTSKESDAAARDLVLLHAINKLDTN